MDNSLLERLHALILANPKTSFTPAEAAARLALPPVLESSAEPLPQSKVSEIEEALKYLAALEREYENPPKFKGIAKVFLLGKVFYEALSDNPDPRRDYDYRATNEGGRDFCPKNMAYYVWAWIEMTEAKCQREGIPNNKTVLMTHDNRYYQPEIIEAAKQAALVRGYRLVFAFAQGSSPSCVSSYSHAARMAKPVLSVFITASHLSLPPERTVVGAKIQILGAAGKLESLTTKEIKIASSEALKRLKADNELWKKMIPSTNYSELSAGESHLRLTLAAVLAALGKLPDTSFYQLSQELKTQSDIDAYLKKIIPSQIPSVFKGLRLVIEGANTSSGLLAEAPFKALGAQTTLLNGEILAIKGPHKADPSITRNLQGLFEEITRQNAHIGLAFDLDGDRGAIVLPDGKGGCELLAPDKLGQVLMAFLMEECGYNQAAKPMYVRDCLATDALVAQAATSGVTLETTDAGYVYLKKREREKAKEGFLTIAMGEASGHAWMDFTGAFENPIVVALLFVAMALGKASKTSGDLSKSDILYKIFNSLTIPYRKTTRFQPLFAPALLAQVAASMWITLEAGKPIPQPLIGQSRSACVKKLMEYFKVGRVFQTPLGRVSVSNFESQWDEDDGIYRFGKIYFSLNGEVIGSFVARGSSNEPTAVAVWEAKEFAGNTYTGQKLPEATIQARFDLVGGLVLTACEELQILELVDHKPAVNMAEVLQSVERYRGMKG